MAHTKSKTKHSKSKPTGPTRLQLALASVGSWNTEGIPMQRDGCEGCSGDLAATPWRVDPEMGQTAHCIECAEPAPLSRFKLTHRRVIPNFDAAFMKRKKFQPLEEQQDTEAIPA